MIPLPTTSKKWGSLWELLERAGDYALLEQKFEVPKKTKDPDEETEYVSRFTVVKVIKAPEATIGGNVITAKEKIPSDSQWGIYGWTFLTKEAAKSKFESLTK